MIPGAIRYPAACWAVLIGVTLAACATAPPGRAPSVAVGAQIADASSATSTEAPTSEDPSTQAAGAGEELERRLVDLRAVERGQAGLEEDLSHRKIAALLNRVAVDWIQAHAHDSERARARVQELLAKLIGPCANLVNSEKRLGASFWRGWWITAYGDDDGAVALGWVLGEDGWQVATCRLTAAPRTRCCGAPTKDGGLCADCEVDAAACFCPRPGDPPPPGDAWQVTCCLAQRTSGRSICRGCLELKTGGGLAGAVERLEQRVRRRAEEARAELALVSRALLWSRDAGLESQAVEELTRAREALRLAQVRYAEQVEVVRAALERKGMSLRQAALKLPEPRLRVLESNQHRLLRRARSQLLIVRQELAERDVSFALSDVAAVGSSSMWLPAGVVEACASAVKHAEQQTGTPQWHRLVRLAPPTAAAEEHAVEAGRKGHDLWLRAMAALDRDDTEGAVDYMERIEDHQLLSGRQCKLFAETLVIRAVGKSGQGDYAAAEVDATRAIGRDPESPWAWGHRGYCRRRQGDFELAARDLLHARELGSSEAAAQLTVLAESFADRAWERNRSNDTEGAVADWRMAWLIETQLRE